MTKTGELSTEEKGTKAPKLSAEQAAMLASASSVDGTLVADVLPHDEEGNLVEAEEPVDKLAGNRQLLGFLVMAATPLMPFLPTCYTDEVISNIAGAFTAVEEKYGWDIGSNIGPEVALAIFTLPPTIAAVTLGRQYFAEQRAQREAAERIAKGGQPKQAQGSQEAAMAGATAGAIGA